MRKKLLISSLVFSLFASLIVSKNSLALQAEEANGYHVEEVIRDKFNKETVDSSWRLNGANQEHYYNALHCVSPVGYGSGPIVSAAKLADKTRFEFTICPQTVMGGANISFNIGMPSNYQPLKEPDVDCKIQIWDTQISYCDYQHNLVLEQPTSLKNLVPTAVSVYDADTDVAIEIDRVDNLTTKVFVEYRRNGKLVSSTEANSFTLSNPRYPNGYCGFFWDCLEMDITNFRVYNNDVKVFDDSGDAFTSNALAFSYGEADKCHYLVYGLNETNIYFANVNTIKMDSANDSIINSYKLVEQKNVSNPYELTYTMKINELNKNSFVGFGYGLSSTDSKIDAKNAIGFLKADDNTAEVVAIRNGVVDRSNNYLVAISKLGNGKNQDYTVSFDYTHKAYLTVNGLTFKFDNIDFVGETGIGLVDLTASKASNFELKEFSLKTNTYKKYASSDISNDFSGKKLSVDGFSEDPYINSQKYFVGPQVALEEDWGTGETSVVFSGAGAYSAFGVRQKYSEFICEFDIEVISRQDYQYIGLSFGRESVVDTLVQASTSSKAFLLRCDNSGASTQQCLWGSGNLFENGSDSQISPVNIYDPEHTKHHFMFVAKNRNLYVYYKDIDAPASEMGILRAFVPNINVDGYVSIVGTNTVSFQVTNYKMVNLSDECKEESCLTIRETFEHKNNVSEKLSLDAVSKVKDGHLVMENSTIQTVNPYLYDIIRFTTYELDNSLQIMFSKGKKVVIDAKNNRIVVNEDGNKTYYDCGIAHLNNIKGKRFEITILGDEVKIGYKGYYDPADKLSTELMSHKFATPLEKDNISFNANGKIVLDDLYLFALDNSMKCDSANYEDDPDNVNIWTVKPDYVAKTKDIVDEATKGCNGSSGSMLALIVLALPLVLRRRKED